MRCVSRSRWKPLRPNDELRLISGYVREGLGIELLLLFDAVLSIMTYLSRTSLHPKFRGGRSVVQATLQLALLFPLLVRTLYLATIVPGELQQYAWCSGGNALRCGCLAWKGRNCKHRCILTLRVIPTNQLHIA